MVTKGAVLFILVLTFNGLGKNKNTKELVALSWNNAWVSECVFNILTNFEK